MTSSPPPPDLGLGWLLGAVHRRIRARWAERLRRYGLTPPQAAVLRTLERRPGCSLRELARIVEAEPINLSRTIEPLEAAGLVVRSTSALDRRAHALTLSDTGRARARELELEAHRFELELHALLAPEPPKLTAWLQDVLERLRRSAPLSPDEGGEAGVRPDG